MFQHQLDQHTWFDLKSAITHQPYASRHVGAFEHIILIPIRVGAYSLMRCAANTRFMYVVLGLRRPGLERMIYRTRGEHVNNYIINAIHNPWHIKSNKNFFFSF